MKLLTRLLGVGLAAGFCNLAAPPAQAAPRTHVQDELARRLDRDRARLDQVAARIERARAAYLDVPLPHAMATLGLARTAFDTANRNLVTDERPEEALRWLLNGERYLDDASMSAVPSRGVETRAMLIDAGSLPKTEAEVVALVDRLADAHFNLLVPEVYRRGYTLYPSAFTERDPEFASAPDVVAALVTEAHKRGMEVQPWIWTFRAKSPGFGNPVLGRLPALGAHQDGHETRFLSAASPEAREYVYGIVNELLGRYDVDGLLLDYIRYDEEIPEDDISRTRYALEYRARHGALPPASVPTEGVEALEWQLWREQQVHTSVQAIARLLHQRHGRLRLGTAVFRGESYARLVKMQHWRHWLNNRWVDWPSPMLYTGSAPELLKWLDAETDHHARRNLVYPLLGVHRMADPRELITEIEELRRIGTPGFMVFALGHVGPQLIEALREGPFREPASLPHRGLIRAGRQTLVAACRYLARVIREATDPDAKALAQGLYTEINATAARLPLDELPYHEHDALSERIRGLEQAARQGGLPGPVLDELVHQLEYAVALIRADQFRVEGRAFVPSSLPPKRPAAPPAPPVE